MADDRGCQVPDSEMVENAMSLSDGDIKHKDNIAWPVNWVGLTLTKEVRRLRAALAEAQKNGQAAHDESIAQQERAEAAEAQVAALKAELEKEKVEFSVEYDAMADRAEKAEAALAERDKAVEEFKSAMYLERTRYHAACLETPTKCSLCRKYEKAFLSPASNKKREQKENCHPCFVLKRPCAAHESGRGDG